MKRFLLIMLLAVAGSHVARAQCAANFTYSVLGTAPPVVAFMNFSSGDSTGSGISYSWDFGDGLTDVNISPVHTYSLMGGYNVCLSLLDNSGCRDTLCMFVNIVPPPPVINAWIYTDSMSAYACISPATVDFFYSVSAQGFSATDTIFEAHVVWGDGSDTTWTYSGVNAVAQGQLHHAYLNAGTYTAQLTVTNINTQTTSSSTGMPAIVASTCGSLSGSVYNDVNHNCIFDTGEEIQNMAVTITNGGNLVGWVQTDMFGSYSVNLPTGNTYEVAIQPNNGYYGLHTPTCPPSGIHSGVTVPITGIDFGVECPAGADLTGTVTGWRFRPGTITSVCVYAYNIRCSTPSGSIEITFDPSLTPLPDTAGVGYTVNGQTVTYSINAPALNWNFCIPVAVSANAQVGDTVCISMNIIAPGDSVPSNNTGTYCFAVRNSYDPNDKYATPAGVGGQGSILPNTPLTYTIRFQNTGNDVAYNVFILDTLDADLDITTLEVMGSSHSMTYSVLTGNILRFSFDNIMLADSFTNEAASHGYVTYRINQVSNVANSAQINNTAAIYFDFNSPIITNTTLNTIDYFLSVAATFSKNDFVSLYPNPSNDKCNIVFNSKQQRTIVMLDAIGKEAFRLVTSEEVITLNTLKFAEGIYTIHVYEGDKTNATKLMINHH